MDDLEKSLDGDERSELRVMVRSLAAHDTVELLKSNVEVVE